MATNQFLPFATAGGANVYTAAAYSALSSRLSGFVNGLADPVAANSALRQGSFMAAMIGQFISDTLAANVNDDGNLANAEAQFIAALNAQIENTTGLFLGETMFNGGASGTFTANANANTLEIYASAAGGGGGGAPATGAAQLSGGGGGGGGAFSKITVNRASFASWFAPWTYSVGNGGASVLGGNGGAGGNTTVNGNVLSGGTGGQIAGPTSATEITATAGIGGNAASAPGSPVINQKGRNGQPSTAVSSQGVLGFGGLGLYLDFGDGGTGSIQVNTLPAAAGFAGLPGILLIRQYT
jgi:hypothetical protein